jgi:hypothetical protein
MVTNSFFQKGAGEFRLTTLGEVSEINHQFSLGHIFIDSYAYHKLILFIPQTINPTKKSFGVRLHNFTFSVFALHFVKL